MTDEQRRRGQPGLSPREALQTLARAYGALPFSAGDITAGVENELQAVVLGRAEHVDLPRAIRASNYYANSVKRAAAGTISQCTVGALERYLRDDSGVWENSWVRLPQGALGEFARETLQRDLLADKSRPDAGPRADVARFHIEEGQEACLRIPVSYLLKLALADVIGEAPVSPPLLRSTGRRLLDHFSNDNTSPETSSFHVIPFAADTGNGRAVARETATRFLLTQLLTLYANSRFGLMERGQRALVYFAPHPPVRQRELNDLVPDAFYRELFMSPCLSGWDQGETKQRYMRLCHEVLSRSQLNGVAKLREAGIITRNLVVLPSTSNVSLANNGTHVSLGSRVLSRALGDPATRFGAEHEKVLGDLVIKVVEHFLPLFVGTYTAAPYRLDFADFHPERVLAFLPHELDYTHLRLLWRRWKRKARLKVLGRPITPFGPRWVDQALALLFGLRGDLVPDFRLLDYPVALLSTDESPALDGQLGNTERLRRDLTDLGVFDHRMAIYLPYRLREHRVHGFSGFEGRHHSLFISFDDLGRAADLQVLVTALAVAYVAQGMVTHAGIPDDPTVESERRQAFFAAAIGLPAHFVAAATPNVFLRRVLQQTDRLRPSRRQPGCLRVRTAAYQRGLFEVLRTDGDEVAEGLGLEGVLTDLALRLNYSPEAAVAPRLLEGILRKAGASSPLAIDARSFNTAAEAYYREDLRTMQMREALALFAEELRQLDASADDDAGLRSAFRAAVGERSAPAYLATVEDELLAERLPAGELQRLIFLVLVVIHVRMGQADTADRFWRRTLDHAAAR